MNNCDQIWHRVLPALLLVVCLDACRALTPDEESALAAEQIEEINSNLAVLSDPEVQGYVDALAERLHGAAASTEPVEVHVVRNDAFNAFAIAGGHVYLTTGVLLGSRNLAELASVMAHEMAHIQQRHLSDNFRRFRNTRTAAEISGILLALLTGNPFIAGAGDLAANVGSDVFITSHTREAEREADALAFRIMLEAGFDPRSQLTLLTRLQAAVVALETAPPFLNTHPLPADRVEAVRGRLEEVPEFNGLIVNDQGGLEALQGLLSR